MKHLLLLLAIFSLTTACQSKRAYQTERSEMQIAWKRIPVTTTSHPNPLISETVGKYKSALDEQMMVVVGVAPEEMLYKRPESKLTNFTSDAMMLLDTKYTDSGVIDLAIMNVNGHRAPIRKGEVTVGDLFSTYSFDNELVVVSLKGTYLIELFRAYAKMGGAGISSTVKLIIGKDKALKSAKVNGQDVDPDKIYTIITLDYLAEGNDGMDALAKAISTTKTNIILREYMIDYVRSLTEKGLPVSAKEDQRIVIEK